jgi:threonine dehydrogenase-like Zn-dependent dehydrogenase
LVEAPEPRLAERADGPGEIIFEPQLGCLCGSDVPFFMHSDVFYPPGVGHSLHEMIGTVVATSGSRFRPGARVLAVPVAQQGLFERYLLSEERAIPLDTRVPEEQALMAQPLGTVIFALKKLPPVLDLTVAVVGQGPMGQLFNLALHNLGAREIIAIDPVESRLAVSPRTGASAVVCNKSDNPVAAVMDITRGELADIVIEVVGHEHQQMNLCIDLCRHDGKILSFGVPPETIDGIKWRQLFFKNITVYTSVNPDFRRDFPLAMRWIGEGRIDVSQIITHRYPLEKIQDAFELFRDRRDGVLKCLIDFPAGRRKTSAG